MFCIKKNVYSVSFSFWENVIRLCDLKRKLLTFWWERTSWRHYHFFTKTFFLLDFDVQITVFVMFYAYNQLVPILSECHTKAFRHRSIVVVA